VSKHFGGIFDFDVKSRRLTEVNSILEDPTIWDDQKKAQALGKEKKLLDGVVATLTDLNTNITGAIELFDWPKRKMTLRRLLQSSKMSRVIARSFMI
jgi:peptide chain release factor 2